MTVQNVLNVEHELVLSIHHLQRLYVLRLLIRFHISPSINHAKIIYGTANVGNIIIILI